jgi:hypothetical protein
MSANALLIGITGWYRNCIFLCRSFSLQNRTPGKGTGKASREELSDYRIKYFLGTSQEYFHKNGILELREVGTSAE